MSNPKWRVGARQLPKRQRFVPKRENTGSLARAECAFARRSPERPAGDRWIVLLKSGSGVGGGGAKTTAFLVVGGLAFAICLSWLSAFELGRAHPGFEQFTALSAGLQYLLFGSIIAAPIFDPPSNAPSEPAISSDEIAVPRSAGGAQKPHHYPASAIELEERLLRRVGAELHNGPAQLIALALLQLDNVLAPQQTGGGGSAKTRETTGTNRASSIRASLQQAMHEIRALSAALTPDFNTLTLSQAIRLAVNNHEHRTQTSIISKFTNLPAIAPFELKANAYRFLEEGLRHAFAHGKSSQHGVRAKWEAGTLHIEVIAGGPDTRMEGLGEPEQVGLLWLRQRVETRGGEFKVESLRGAETRILACFGVSERNAFDG